MNNDLWCKIKEMLVSSNRKIIIITDEPTEGKKAVESLQITPSSALGSIVFNTSGIIVDDWIRILGHDSLKNRGVISCNMLVSNGLTQKIEKMLIVADDVVGGVFALNAGKFTVGLGEVWYFAPDTLSWETLGMKYAEFLAWCAHGNVDEFYSMMRWSTWKEICKNVKFDEGLLIYPFLWSKELEIESADKNIVPVDELFQLNQENSRKIDKM